MSFRLKLILFTVLMQVLFLSGYCVFSVQRVIFHELSRADDRNRQDALIFDTVVASALYSFDYVTVDTVAKTMASAPSVAQVIVFTSDGQEIARSGGATASYAELHKHSLPAEILFAVLGHPSVPEPAVRIISSNDQIVGRVEVVPDIFAIEAEIEHIVQSFVQAGLLGCVVVTAFAWQAGALLTKRLRRLTEGARRIAEGDLAHRLKASGRDEVARIGQAIDAMADALIRRRNEAETRARTDALTGLLNRTGLVEAMARQNADGLPCTVLHLDLDRFKLINDTRGHDAGDAVLSAMADRMRAVSGPIQAVARIGGDEFVLLLHCAPDDAAAVAVAEALIETIKAPVNYCGTLLRVGASVGLAALPAGPHPEDVLSRLLTDADIALYQAKTAGRGQAAVFDAAARAAREAEADLEMELTDALAQSAFVPFIQPQLDVLTGQVVGAEVLARWTHPTRGILPPGAFLERLRNPELAEAIDIQVRTKALRWMARVDGPRPCTLSLNLTPGHLSRNDGAERFHREVVNAGLSPSVVVVEVHENVILETNTPVMDNLAALTQMGHPLELDDFGTGKASLQSLMHIKVDTLKIDRSFVTGIDRDPDRRAIVGAVLGVGRAMGVQVLAEGVETRAECDALIALGCTVVQGYLIARPMPLSAFGDWVSQAQTKMRGA